MKRDHDDNTEESLTDRLQTPIRALIQQSSADRIYSQLQGGKDPSPVGDLAENTLSPGNQPMEQQPKRLFSTNTQKSDFWSKKLSGGTINSPLTPGGTSGFDNKHAESSHSTQTHRNTYGNLMGENRKHAH